MKNQLCRRRRTKYSIMLATLALSIVISIADLSHSLGQDRGLNTPLSNLKSAYADLLAQAAKKIPRSQKYQILNRIRHSLKASKKKNDPEALLELANEYKRYRFYKEAIQLFEEVANNSSNDNMSLMRANRFLAEVEFVANDDIQAAIKGFKKAIILSPKNSIDRADMLGRLGSYYFIDDQTDKMLETYKEFNKLPEHIKKSVPDSYVKANLYSARFTTDPDEAAKFFKVARDVAEDYPKLFPPDFIISISSEQNNQLPWNSVIRIKRLVQLVENKKYAKEPKIQEFALEVLMAYFLERKKDWKRFDDFAEQTRKLFANAKPKSKTDTTQYSLASQALGIYVGAAESEQKKWDKSRSRRDFQKWQEKLKTMKFFFPNKIKPKDVEEIMSAYREGAKLLRDDGKKKD